jgi:hypothetical protein
VNHGSDRVEQAFSNACSANAKDFFGLPCMRILSARTKKEPHDHVVLHVVSVGHATSVTVFYGIVRTVMPVA